MQVQFNCECGVRLSCAVRSIGKSKVCPSCNRPILIPAPRESVVRDILKPVPTILPRWSREEYVSAVSEIAEWSVFNNKVAMHTGHGHLAVSWIDDAIRSLRNIAIFVEDSVEKDGGNIEEDRPCFALHLASLAAGTSFGGSETRESKMRSYKKWLKEQKSKPTSVGGDSQDPLRSQILELIDHLRSSARQISAEGNLTPSDRSRPS